MSASSDGRKWIDAQEDVQHLRAVLAQGGYVELEPWQLRGYESGGGPCGVTQVLGRIMRSVQAWDGPRPENHLLAFLSEDKSLCVVVEWHEGRPKGRVAVIDEADAREALVAASANHGGRWTEWLSKLLWSHSTLFQQGALVVQLYTLHTVRQIESGKIAARVYRATASLSSSLLACRDSDDPVARAAGENACSRIHAAVSGIVVSTDRGGASNEPDPK